MWIQTDVVVHQDLENKRMEKADRKAAKKDAKKAAKKSLKHAKKGKEESGEDVADRDDWKRRAVGPTTRLSTFDVCPTNRVSTFECVVGGG